MLDLSTPNVSSPDVHAAIPPLTGPPTPDFGTAHEGDVGRSRRDPGQAAVLLVIVVVTLAALIVSGLAELGVSVRDRGRAAAAADAAALAALADGQDGGAGAAATIAAANGATLVSFTAAPARNEVTVVVRVGDETARASATGAP